MRNAVGVGGLKQFLKRVLLAPALIFRPTAITVVAALCAWMALNAVEADADCRQTQAQVSDMMFQSRLTAILVEQIAIRNDIMQLRLGPNNGTDNLVQKSATIDHKASYISKISITRQSELLKLRDEGKLICGRASKLSFWAQSFALLVALLATVSVARHSMRQEGKISNA